MASRVVTYAYAYVSGTVDLCARHAETVKGLGPVSHGEHMGTCDECARRPRPVDITGRMSTAGRVGGLLACAKAVGAHEDEQGRLVGLDEACVLEQGHRGDCEARS